MSACDLAPRCFREGATEAERAAVDAWWSGLRAAERRELSALVDPRAESCSYSQTQRSDGSSAWYGVALRLRGRFVDGEEGPPIAEDTFPVDLYEYAVGHPVFLDNLQVIHVCTQHEAARVAVRAGLIPASFSCPLRREMRCPMRRALALSPGRSLHVEAHAEVNGRRS